MLGLDGLSVDGPDGRRLGRRGLPKLPGVQSGTQSASKGAKAPQKGKQCQIAALLRFPFKKQEA